jgi:hypothetical protein
MGGQGTRDMQLLDDLRNKRGYWELNEEPLYAFCEEYAFEETRICCKRMRFRNL